MKKKIKIFGKEIKRATRRKLMENVMENWEMKDTYSKAKYRQSPREGGIESVFGQYGEEMDPAVLRYMRKNPDAILRRMAKLYPEIYMRHVPSQAPVMDDWEFEEEVVSEEENMNITSYDLTDEKDVKTLNDKLDSGLDSKKIDVGMSKAQVTNETRKHLNKLFRSKKKV